MKVSLSFQPFVKPLYKDFCIQKIQQTVTEIKNHFKFSKKQNIYQSQRTQSKSKDKLIQTAALQQQLNKTVKNSFYQKSKTTDEFYSQSSQKYNFSANREESPQKKSLQNSQLYQPQKNVQKKQQRLQEQQLVKFLQKVEQTMSDHTKFYQNIIQEIQLMNKKQSNLQMTIIQLSKLTFQKNRKVARLQTFSLPENNDNENFMASLTFRNQNFINQCNQNRSKTEGQSRNSFECKIDEGSKNKATYFLPKQQKKQLKISQLRNAQFTKQLDLDSSQSNIYRNADFLISFMKLEQQFNKIKKKSQFKQFQDLTHVRAQ